MIDGVDQGSPVPLNGAGQATVGTSTLALGSYSVQARYLGDSKFDPSTSGILTQVVLPPTPVITLKVNGQHPMPPTVTTTGPMLLTFDVSASAYTASLLWYWGLIIN